MTSENLTDAEFDEWHARVTDPETSTLSPMKPTVTRLSDVTPTRIDWLWRGYIPLGYATVVEGDPDIGKSTTMLDIAARVTTGREMPDGSPGLGRPRNVLLMTAEDGLDDVVVHRAQLAGADVSRLLHVGDVSDGTKSMPLTLPTHTPLIGDLVRQYDAPLLIVDVLSAYVDGTVRLTNEQDGRAALRPLQEFAHRHRCALALIRHLTKGGGSHAVYRGAGAISIIGAARSALLFARDPQDDTKRVVAQVKHNLSKSEPAIGYQLVGAATDPDYAVVEWLGAVSYDATAILAEAGADPAEREMADELVGMLRKILDSADGGEVLVRDAIKELRGLGIDPAKATLFRARKRAGIQTRKSDLRGGWIWYYGPEGSP